jgi:hypothetical protein
MTYYFQFVNNEITPEITPTTNINIIANHIKKAENVLQTRR